jgi:spore coat polysaccharide biosynthesis protein SpsF
MKTAIIICTRLSSSRVPRKALLEVEGKPILRHLIDRLKPLDIPIIIAAPTEEIGIYKTLKVKGEKNLFFFSGHADDPLVRMYLAARRYKVENIIRVTHDKIFVDTKSISEMLNIYEKYLLNYVYHSELIPGTGAEVIRYRTLEEAADKYRGVEFISYAIRAVTKEIRDAADHFRITNPQNLRLLIDYQDDVKLIELLLSRLGAGASLSDVLTYAKSNAWVSHINALPLLTVYTCVHNGVLNKKSYLKECLESVRDQRLFNKSEYIIVDDHSTDETTEVVANFCAEHQSARWVRNKKNIGLAASSNVALSLAKSPYIIRIDADDFFTNRRSTEELLTAIKNTDYDAVVPNNYFGEFNKIQTGKEGMHIGGTIFKTRAINHIKFDDKLRNYDGLDFFTRARKELSIGYLNRPVFLYRQHADSMSHTNLEERARVKREIETRAEQQ